MKPLIFFLGLVIVSALRAQGPNMNSLTGTWNWDFTMPDTSVVHPKLKLVHTNAQLTGVSVLRPGTETTITNATIQGQQVRFDVVRVNHGVPVVTSYAGKWEGDFIKGTVHSTWTGVETSYPWQARRYSSLTGNWKWSSRSAAGRGETRAKLKLEEGKLTGSIRGRDGRDTAITNASYKDGEITFEVERERDGAAFVYIYTGVFADGVIEGTMELITEDNPDGRKSDWKAERVE